MNPGNLGKEAFIQVGGELKTFHTIQQAYELMKDFAILPRLLQLLEKADQPLEEGREEEVLLISYDSDGKLPYSISLETVVDWNFSTDHVIIRGQYTNYLALRKNIYRCKAEQRLCEIFNNREKNRE